MDGVGVFAQGEDISSITSQPYACETACRVINLYMSLGDVPPKKQHCGPLRKLSDHDVTL